MEKELFVKMDINAIHNGIIAKVGVKNFAILAVIATFSDSNGNSFPSQEKIAEMTGYSRQTVNKALKELRDLDVDGKRILTVTQRRSANGISNQYNLSNDVGFSFGKRQGVVKETDKVVNKGLQGVVNTGRQEQEPTNKIHTEQEPTNKNQKDIVFDNSKDVLNYFQQIYFETYNVAYNPNYGRDMGMIKNKLMKLYTSDEIKLIIDVAFRDYEKRWANPKFPRVTLGQICSWLANEAIAIATNEKQNVEKAEQDSERYSMDEDDWDRIMDLI